MRRALLVYLILVWLFAWAPFNGWLFLIGGAFHWHLNKPQKIARRNLNAVPRQAR